MRIGNEISFPGLEKDRIPCNMTIVWVPELQQWVYYTRLEKFIVIDGKTIPLYESEIAWWLNGTVHKVLLTKENGPKGTKSYEDPAIEGNLLFCNRIEEIVHPYNNKLGGLSIPSVFYTDHVHGKIDLIGEVSGDQKMRSPKSLTLVPRVGPCEEYQYCLARPSFSLNPPYEEISKVEAFRLPEWDKSGNKLDGMEYVRDFILPTEKFPIVNVSGPFERTPHAWALPFHRAVVFSNNGMEIKIYEQHLLFTALKDPLRVIAVSERPFLVRADLKPSKLELVKYPVYIRKLGYCPATHGFWTLATADDCVAHSGGFTREEILEIFSPESRKLIRL